MKIMAKKKKSEPRKLSDEEMLQKELEILQNIYGEKEGRKKFLEIQAKEEGSTDETWHDREERKKQERVDKWEKKLQGLGISELIHLREKVREDVKRKKKRALYSREEEETYLDTEAFYDTIEKAISEGPPKNIWTGKKGDFANFVAEEYHKDPTKFSSDKKIATKIIFNDYEFPDFPDWKWEQCYDLVKKYA
jgi:hypothetical protein